MKEKGLYGVLSDREEQVLLLAAKGLTDKEVAKKLELSVATVNTYWVRIRRKLGGTNRAELIAEAMQLNAEETLTAKELENQRLVSEIIRRNDAERALRESQERLQAIIDGTPVFVYIKDLHGRYTLVNKEFESLFGRSRQEILSRRDVDLWPAERFRAFRESEAEVMQSGEQCETEDVLQTSNGSKVFLTVRFPLIGADGKPYAVCGFGRDITPRKLAAQRIAVQYAISNILAEESPMDVVTPNIAESVCESLGCDYGGLWLYKSANNHHNVGQWSVPESVPGEFLEAMKAEHYEGEEFLVGELLKEKGPILMTDLSGTEGLKSSEIVRSGFSSAVGIPIRAGKKTLGLIFCFSKSSQYRDEQLLDVLATIGSQIGQFLERKKAEEDRETLYSELKLANETLERRVRTRTMELEESNRKLEEEIQVRASSEDQLVSAHLLGKTYLENSDDGVIAFDRSCRYTVWNRKMEEISGLSREDVIGKYAFDLFPFLTENGEDDFFHRVLRGENVKGGTRDYMIEPKGKRGVFETHYVPLKNEKGEVVGGMGIVRQVEEEKTGTVSSAELR